MKCPYCLSERLRVWRKAKDTIYQCEKCHSNIKVFHQAIDVYDDAYFGEHYEQVYGKSYEEDEPIIRSYSRRRLATIKEIVPSGHLVDVGAAYGFFADEAHQMGYDVSAVEIHDASIRYMQDRFGYPVYRSLELITQPVDIITLWFTMEHFPDVNAFMDTVKNSLRQGGCLALGLPNGYGSFARFCPSEYLKKRPIEHHTEPSLKGISCFLKRHGFRVVHEEIFGLHPERIGLPNTALFKNVLKITRLGDTFEVYAVKQ